MGVKKRDVVSHRAWNIVRVALLWARKGGVFKRRLVMEMRLVPKYLRRLAHTSTSTTSPAQLYYCERQLSFDNTPIFPRPSSMRFHLPHIPCINPPHLDFDYDFDHNEEDDDHNNGCSKATSGHNIIINQQQCEDEAEAEGIDVRAEEFIAKFYQQMKLQRQLSYLHYNQTPTTHSS